MSDYITDPDLLAALSGQGAPAPAPAAPTGYVTDPTVLDALKAAPAKAAEAKAHRPDYLKVSPEERQDALTAFGGNLVNTALLNVPRNIQAASNYMKGYWGNGPQYDSFEQAYQHAKAVDAQGDADHPVAQKAGIAAGLATALVGGPEAGAAAVRGVGALSAPAARLLAPSMEATYQSGVLPSLATVGRSAATGGGVAATGEYLNSHDLKRAAAAGAMGAAGGIAGDAAGNLVKPLLSNPTKLDAYELAQLAASKAAPTSGPAAFRAAVAGPALASIGKDIANHAISSTAGAAAGATVGSVIPLDHGTIGGAAAGALAGAVRSPDTIGRYTGWRDGLENAGRYYPRDQRLSGAVGAAIPVILHGLLGDPDQDPQPLQVKVRPNNR